MTDIANLIGDKNGVAGGHTSYEPEHRESGIHRQSPHTAESHLPSNESGKLSRNNPNHSPRSDNHHRDNDKKKKDLKKKQEKKYEQNHNA
ncbi:MAG: hypothetical protein J5819_09765 [Eubacterium sp.]|nr:hypothetical protein [Eubacterium sp.]